MNKKHFAGLDGLRFVSITFVVLHHLFTFKKNFGFTGFDYPVLGTIGFYGIQFFFMGSGFLITYLLLHEHDAYGKISLRNFFLRRVLRIWPAYYLLILFFVLVLKQEFFKIPGLTDAYLNANYKTSNKFFFFFLPHVQPFLFPTGPYVHHTYTIGIEEQFYIAWGLLFYFFRKFVVAFFVLLLISIPLLNFLHSVTFEWVTQDSSTPISIKYFNSMVTYLKYSRFSTFAIGSLFGYAYFRKQQWVYMFRNRLVQFGLYLILFFSVFYNVQLSFFEHEYISILMACLMLTATFKKESLLNYSAGWVSYLGKISYGIYLFHIFAIVFACKIVRLFFLVESDLTVTLLLCLLTLGLSIFFGEVSYRFYERYFLRLKERFRNPYKNKTLTEAMVKNKPFHEK